MNMSFVPSPSPEAQLEKIRQTLRAITTVIQQSQAKSTQQTLIRQAQAWGWSIKKGTGRHPTKATRPGYGAVAIPGHGSGRPIKSGTAFSILQSLAAPLRQELQGLAKEIQEDMTQNTLNQLQTQVEAQAHRIAALEAQVLHYQAEAETGLSLAAEVEERNTLLSRQIWQLQQDLLELDTWKQKVMVLIHERQQIEAKLDLFVGDFEAMEMTLDHVNLFALSLPEEYKLPLLEILRQFPGQA